MINVGHLTTGDFDIPLKPDTPTSVLDNIDIRPELGGRGYARLLVCSQHLDPTSVAVTAIEDQAFYGGVLYAHGRNRQSLAGYGLARLLGEDDGGVLWAAAETTQTGWTVNQHLDEWVFGGTGVDRGNGLTKGATTSDATTFGLRFKPGQTPRQTLATICRRRGLEWRANPDATVDVDTAANLFQSGQTLLIDEGGRDGTINGVTADLSLEGIDLDAVVDRQYVDWQGDGTSLGLAINTLPASWDAPDGDGIQNRGYMRGTESRKLRDRDDVDKVTAWINVNQASANVTAGNVAADKASYRFEVTAEIDDHHPLRHLAPGDTVWCYDPRLSIYDTANQITYRGRVVFPVALRVQDVAIPCRAEYGYYLVTGSGTVIDITRWVEPENRQAVVTLGQRRRYTKAKPRQRKVNRRKNRTLARLFVYLNRLR